MHKQHSLSSNQAFLVASIANHSNHADKPKGSRFTLLNVWTITQQGLKQLLTQTARWQAKQQQRQQLRQLSDRLLDDIGISRAQAEKEAAKPFWR